MMSDPDIDSLVREDGERWRSRLPEARGIEFSSLRDAGTTGTTLHSRALPAVGALVVLLAVGALALLALGLPIRSPASDE
jgi:hypothetical protein